MASADLSKVLPTGNVVYDSRADTSTGKKRAVIATGGKSVAERALLFGPQISKTPSIASNPPAKVNTAAPSSQYQRLTPSVDRPPVNAGGYSAPRRAFNPPNSYRPPPVAEIPPVREQSAYNDTRSYSSVTRPTANPPRAAPPPSFIPIIPQPIRRPSPQATYQAPAPHDYYPEESDEDVYSAYYPQERVSSYDIPPPTSSYFQPIQDPLEVLYRTSAQGYPNVQMPAAPSMGPTNLQSFDLGNLINRIQEDYLQTVRPYVASVQFVETNPQFNGTINAAAHAAPLSSQQDFLRGRRPDYDFIRGRNGYGSYERLLGNHGSNGNPYMSVRRGKHRQRYQDQASSPINILSNKSSLSARRHSDVPPITIPPPVVASSSEDEEVTEPTEKTAAETSSEEETASEEESEAKAPTPVPVPVPKVEMTPVVARVEPPRPAPAAKESESEDTETEQSESESDSESDDDDDDKKKKKKKSKRKTATRSFAPATSFNTSAVPRASNTPQLTTPQARVQRANPVADTKPRRESSTASQRAEKEEVEPITATPGKWRSFTSKFRRK